MNYEKKYKEALKRARMWRDKSGMPTDIQGILDDIFPELKESEDEKIRKELLEHCKNQAKPYIQTGNKCPQIQSWIAWLEKQGEQKLVDKVEPKFHKGDWTVSNLDGKVRQISEVHFDEYNSYYVVNGMPVNLEEYDRLHHLWTIQDAKEGDVLAVEAIEENYQHPFVAIYKERGLDFFNSYCFIGFDGKFYEGVTGHSTEKIHPATKEQRNTLFAKMREAGYERDKEKKELKKIVDEEYNGEDYGIDSLWHAKNILEETLGKVDGYRTDDGILEHKCAIAAVNKLYKQKPTEWSEEDENRINRLIAYFEGKESLTAEDDIVYAYWLKSLRPQNTWKPSDEQMKQLGWIAEQNKDNMIGKELISLYQDLKKLREE